MIRVSILLRSRDLPSSISSTEMVSICQPKLLPDVAPVFFRSTQARGVRDAVALDLDRLGIEYCGVLQNGHTGCVD
jgi:hypothetical protein